MNLSFRTLNADEIDVRVAQISDKGCSLLLYKNARVDMDLLDETVGAMNWKREHFRNNANCVVSIYNPETEEWVSKEDTGTESNTEAEKGLASDSFKRACVNWGIGRELYTAPFIWINASGVNVEPNKNGKQMTKDRFSVKDISCDTQRRICKLTIYNERKRKVVFEWSSGKPAVFEDDEPAEKPKLAEVIVNPVCERCMHPITGITTSKGEMYTPQDIVANSLVRAGKKLCFDCFKQWNAEMKKAAG